MESDLQQHHKPQQNMNSSSSLLRYRSAPSSYFANVLDTEFNEPFFNRAASPETESILARFMSSQGGDVGVTEEVVPHQKVEITQQPQFLVPKLDNDTAMIQQQQQQHEQHEQHQHKQQQQSRMNNYTSQGFNQIPSAKPPLPNQNLASSKEGALAYPMGSNQFPPMKTGGLTHSNLIRTSSSPAGLFANINIDVAGYAALRGMGNVGVNNSTNEEASFSPSSRLKNFSSGLPISPSSRMSPIPEVRKRRNRSNNQEHVGGGFNEGRGNSYVSGFNMGSWEDSSLLPDEIIGSTDFIDEDEDVKRITGLNASEYQNMVAGNRPLAHHLSLPRTSAEMATIESFMQYQDSVPCKIRAKRGCATHPRSIAERVRRTRISERMRKLQELVPNMDKQTNTADMLDLAVDYIKDLQTEVQTLSGARSKCTCSSQQNQ